MDNIFRHEGGGIAVDDTDPAHGEEVESIAHALLRDRLHRFSDDGGKFSDDGFSDDDAWDLIDTAAAPIADDIAKSIDPKALHDAAAAQDAAPPSPVMSASDASNRSQAVGDDTDTAAAPIADVTAKSDDPKNPRDGAAAQDAAPLSTAMPEIVAGGRSQDDGDATDTVAASIFTHHHLNHFAYLCNADGTAKSDDPTEPRDGAAAQDAAPPSPAMSASVAGDQSQADGDGIDAAAASIVGARPVEKRAGQKPSVEARGLPSAPSAPPPQLRSLPWFPSGAAASADDAAAADDDASVTLWVVATLPWFPSGIAFGGGGGDDDDDDASEDEVGEDGGDLLGLDDGDARADAALGGAAAASQVAAMSASVAGDRSQADGDDTDAAAEAREIAQANVRLRQAHNVAWLVAENERAAAAEREKAAAAEAEAREIAQAKLVAEKERAAAAEREKAAPIADGTAKPDDPKAPRDDAAAQDAALLSPAMSASVAGDRSQADGDDTPASEWSCKRGLSTDSSNASNSDALPEDRDSTTKAGAACRGVWRTPVAVVVLIVLIKILIAAGVASAFWNETHIAESAVIGAPIAGDKEVAFWNETYIAGSAVIEAPIAGDKEVAAAAGFDFISAKGSVAAADEYEEKEMAAAKQKDEAEAKKKAKKEAIVEAAKKKKDDARVKKDAAAKKKAEAAAKKKQEAEAKKKAKEEAAQRKKDAAKTKKKAKAEAAQKKKDAAAKKKAAKTGWGAAL